MSWYDIFSKFYDLGVESVYRDYRPQIADALRLEPGDAVLVPACGTGQDFASLVERVGPQGVIVGVDLSEGMLARAQARVEKNGWDNVILLQRDVCTMDSAEIRQLLGDRDHFDGLLFPLALSVVPGWEAVFEAAFELLAPGGRCAVFDIWAKSWVPQTSYVKLIARADPFRQTWAPLERLAVDFTMNELKGSPHLHGGTPILAAGRRA